MLSQVFFLLQQKILFPLRLPVRCTQTGSSRENLFFSQAPVFIAARHRLALQFFFKKQFPKTCLLRALRALRVRPLLFSGTCIHCGSPQARPPVFLQKTVPKNLPSPWLREFRGLNLFLPYLCAFREIFLKKSHASGMFFGKV